MSNELKFKRDPNLLSPQSKQKSDSGMNYLVFTKKELQAEKAKIQERLKELEKKIDITDFGTSTKSDDIIRELEEMQVDTRNYDFGELEKKIIHLLGKRILIVQIQYRREEAEKKKRKKEEIEECFFRHKKIKKFDYDRLIEEKLLQNSYIAKPYSSGKGFIQSTVYYASLAQLHEERLDQCEFLNTLKEVNKIYLSSYSSYSNLTDQSFTNGTVFRITLVLWLILVILGIATLFRTIDNMIYYFIGNCSLVIISLTVIGMKNFFQKPNHNNQLEQIKCDVKIYLQRINEVNSKYEKNFRWICPDNFMYLQVHFQF